MDFLALLQAHLPSILQYRYLILFLAGCLEGFNTFLVAGFLISTGVFELFPAALAAFTAEIISSYFWYGVGYWFGARPLDFFIRNSNARKGFFERIRANIEYYTGPIMLIAKLTWSFTIVILITIGSLKYPIKKFSFYNFIGSIGWIIITFSIGYSFGTGYQLYVEYFKNISYLIVLVVLAFIAIRFMGLASQGIIFRVLTGMDKIKQVGGRIYGEFEKKFPEENKNGKP